MKTKNILTLLLFFIGFLTIHAQPSLIARLCQTENVNAIHITPHMFKQMHNMKEKKGKKAAIINKLEELHIIHSSNPRSIHHLQNILAEKNRWGYVNFMKIQRGNTYVTLYNMPCKKSWKRQKPCKRRNKFLLTTEVGKPPRFKEMIIVFIKGELTLEELKQLQKHNSFIIK